MNENDGPELNKDVMTFTLEQTNASGRPAPLEQVISTCLAIRRTYAAAARVQADVHRPRRRFAVATGRVYLGPTIRDSLTEESAMTLSGATCMFPGPSADHRAEARKLAISPQQILIILITLIVLAVPAVVFSSDLRLMIGAYVGIAATYAAGYTFSDRGKRNRR